MEDKPKVYKKETVDSIMNWIWENHFNTNAFMKKTASLEDKKRHEEWIKDLIEEDERD